MAVTTVQPLGLHRVNSWLIEQQFDAERPRMARPPQWLKRLLLPLWNGGHRLAWRAGEYFDALRHRRFERCVVCGRIGAMLYRSWVIPPRLEELWGLSPRVSEALARKESLDCSRCSAKLRVRRLARVLLDTFPLGDPPAPAASVKDWVLDPRARQLRVAEINIIEGLHTALCNLPGLAYSEFCASRSFGSMVDGIRSEDLTRLSYPDASFDLVLTSETLEHVPNLDAALTEIRRVLAPGGWHVFTVPLLPGVPRTFARAEIRASGETIHKATSISHPGGDTGYPVFTEFGADLPEILHRAGFSVQVAFGPVTEDDVAQVYACRKEDS
jgi:SAM-dependent methyltransferase